MSMYIDKMLTNGLVHFQSDGGNSFIIEGDTVVFKNPNEEGYRARFVTLNKGETLKVSVSMKTGPWGHFKLTGMYADKREELLCDMAGDDADNLKLYTITYTVPANSDYVSFGIYFQSIKGNTTFYNPRIEIQNKVEKSPDLISYAMINYTDGSSHPYFPNSENFKIEKDGHKLKITLDMFFQGTTTRPLVLATDNTPQSKLSNAKLSCADIAIVDNKCQFYAYFTDEKNQIVGVEGSFFSFLVFY